MFIIKLIDKKYGSYKGLIRKIICYLKTYVGYYNAYLEVDYGKIKRVVFVCQGNICRSPFAHRLLQAYSEEVASFGISGNHGGNADSQACIIAKLFDVDLSAHQVTSAKNFDFKDGDLYLCMEDRHLKPLESILKINKFDYQVSFLGFWDKPKNPLIYDPYRLNDDYFKTCYSNIKRCIENLIYDLEKVSFFF